MAPPSFAAFTSYPDGIPVHYERFFLNRLRDTFGFAGVPVRLFFRKRSRPGEGEGEAIGDGGRRKSAPRRRRRK